MHRKVLQARLPGVLMSPYGPVEASEACNGNTSPVAMAVWAFAQGEVLNTTPVLPGVLCALILRPGQRSLKIGLSMEDVQVFRKVVDTNS